MQVPKGNPYHSATSGEMAIYRANSLILRKVAPPAISSPFSLQRHLSSFFHGSLRLPSTRVSLYGNKMHQLVSREMYDVGCMMYAA